MQTSLSLLRISHKNNYQVSCHSSFLSVTVESISVKICVVKYIFVLCISILSYVFA